MFFPFFFLCYIVRTRNTHSSHEKKTFFGMDLKEMKWIVINTVCQRGIIMIRFRASKRRAKRFTHESEIIFIDAVRKKGTINSLLPYRGDTPASPHNQVYMCEADQQQRGTRADYPSSPGRTSPFIGTNTASTNKEHDQRRGQSKESIVQQACEIHNMIFVFGWIFQTNEWIEASDGNIQIFFHSSSYSNSRSHMNCF